jgi:hypothetical protein
MSQLCMNGRSRDAAYITGDVLTVDCGAWLER